MKILINIIVILIISFSFCIDIKAQSLVWNKYYDYLNQDNYGKDVVQTFDSCYILLTNNIVPNNSTIFLIKIDQNGKIVWERAVEESLNLISQSIQQTSDSCYIISGYGEKRMFILKIDSYGIRKWIKFYNKSNTETRSYKIILLENNYILSCGARFYQDSVKHYIVKTDNLGDIIWDKEYSDSLRSSAFDIIESYDKNYFFCGTTINNDLSGNTYCTVKKINNNGELIWSQVFGKRKTSSGIVQLSTDEFFVGGTLDSIGVNRFMFIAKVNDSGNLLWQKAIEPGGRCNSTLKDNNRNIILSGSISINGHGDAGIVKVNEFGNIVFTKTLNYTPVLFYSLFNNIRNTYDKGFIFVGITDYPGLSKQQNVLAIKSDSGFIAPTVGIINNISNNEKVEIESKNYPNPFNPTTKISFYIPFSNEVTLKVFDITGKQVRVLLNEYKQQGNYNIEFDGNNLSSGVYYYKLESGSFIEIKKMVLIK